MPFFAPANLSFRDKDKEKDPKYATKQKKKAPKVPRQVRIGCFIKPTFFFVGPSAKLDEE